MQHIMPMEPMLIGVASCGTGDTRGAVFERVASLAADLAFKHAPGYPDLLQCAVHEHSSVDLSTLSQRQSDRHTCRGVSLAVQETGALPLPRRQSGRPGGVSHQQ